ncbi:MAG: (Fe-S)-binding protein [Candidatus Thorarchaeota archaeon]|nr:MAG: disulfide reductase [Candidatus Thorarchaeota archaeon]RLI59794.1 MAG: disulfide reductase [Candidatus Thorarchaeota archaeon]
MTSLEDLRKINARCIHCRACQYAYSGEPDRQGETEEYTGMLQGCPAGIYFGWEGYFNSGKQWMARAWLNGEIEPSQELLEVVEACTTCGMCETQCPNYIETVHVTEELRAAIIEAGVEPLPRHKVIGERVKDEKLRNPYNEAREERTAWFEGPADRFDAKVAYFVGCTGAYRQQHIAKRTASILKKLGIDFTVLSQEVCCGSPILRTGQKEIFREVMEKNLELFKDFDMLVFSCAGCYKTFRNDYPRISGKPLPFKVRHTVELVYDLIQEGKLTINKEYAKKVTWHDPCHSVRHVGLAIEKEILAKSDNWLMDSRKAEKAKEEHFEIPRVVLRNIPGLELHEMYRIKGDSFCCGAGGGVKTQFPDMALATAKERLREAASTGAEILMTSCPFCVTNFNDAVKALQEEQSTTGEKKPGADLKVVELLEVLDELIE